MSLMTLLIAVFITCVLVWVLQQGSIPAPFHWIVWAVIVIVWLALLLNATGFGGHLSLG